MYKIISITGVGILAASTAFAGGYQPPVVESPVIVAPDIATISNWEGAYVGGTLGYVVSGKERVGFTAMPADYYVGDAGDVDLSGVQGGLRLGYRMQRDAWVFGAELGYEVSRAKDKLSYDNAVGAGELESKIDNVLALRFKTGRVVDDRTLIYGIAGVARVKASYGVNGTIDGAALDTKTSYNHSGYVVGLGIERQFTDRWSVTGEIEHGNFGKTNLDVGAGKVTRATPKYNIVRVGVNYRF